MNIYQTKWADGKYRAVITSDKPIFVTYQDLIELSGVTNFEMDPSDIYTCLNNEGCPTPINHNEGVGAPIEDGIWVYERLFAFFDWMMNHSAYATMMNTRKHGE